MTNLDVLYRKVAKELNITLELAEKICRFQFLYAKQQIESEEFNTVRFPLLGSVKPMPDRLRKWQAKQQKEEPEQEYWFQLQNGYMTPIPGEGISEATKEKIRKRNEDSGEHTTAG